MSARPGLCGGHQATGVPTAIAIFLRQWPRVTIAPPKSEPHVVSLRESRLLVLHCPLCGDLIAASPNPKIILMAAELHSCYAAHELP